MTQAVSIFAQPAITPPTKPRPKSDVEKLMEYLVSRNPTGIARLLVAEGYAVDSGDQMRRGLLEWVAKKGEPAMLSIVREHPDYELIAGQVAEKVKSQPVASPVTVSKTPVKRNVQADVLSISTKDLLHLFMFLVLVWLTLKIFSQ